MGKRKNKNGKGNSDLTDRESSSHSECGNDDGQSTSMGSQRKKKKSTIKTSSQIRASIEEFRKETEEKLQSFERRELNLDLLQDMHNELTKELETLEDIFENIFKGTKSAEIKLQARETFRKLNKQIVMMRIKTEPVTATKEQIVKHNRDIITIVCNVMSGRHYRQNLYQQIDEQEEDNMEIDQSQGNTMNYARALTNWIDNTHENPNSTQNRPKPKPAPKKKNIVIIEPKATQGESVEMPTAKTVEETVFKHLDRKACPISIIKSRRTLKGLYMELDNVDDCRKIEDAVTRQKEFESLQTRIPPERLPTMIIYGVGDEIEDKDLITEICEINSNLELHPEEIKFCTSNKPTKNKEGRLRNVLIRVEDNARKKLKEAERIKCGLRMLKIVDKPSVPRCYNCQGFWHVAKTSRNEINCKRKVICSECGIEGHSHKNCPTKDTNVLKCVNCDRAKKLNVNHSAQDPECPVYKAQVREYIRECYA